ncbi:MAG: hypothetical protein E4H17_00215 [Gemmatimonadales bacterium]|nr:MAG: hypothetical protein E4H17_00215 [Gemmatimonadales bacterium]
MARLLSILLWTTVFLLIMLAIDQFLLRVPASVPAHAAVATFYRDLRSRLLDLAVAKSPLPVKAPGAPAKPAPPDKTGEPATAPPGSIEAIIEQQRPQRAAPPPAPGKGKGVKPAPADPVARYLYADEQGTLHFAATLAEIPEQYRDKARLMGE